MHAAGLDVFLNSEVVFPLLSLSVCLCFSPLWIWGSVVAVA